MSDNAPKEPDHKKLLLQLIGSLTLCDHMGDVSNDVSEVLKRLGMEAKEWNEWCELGHLLGDMGITTLYGSEIGHKDEPIADCQYCKKQA